MHIAEPFPESEASLCAFVATLARQGLAPASIRTYLAAVRHTQVVRGLPEPRQHSSLPRLQLLQSGVRRDRAERGQATPRPRLPITPPILHWLKSSWGRGPNDIMLWAVSVTCFFGFFHAGKLTAPSQSAFEPRVHLTWRDITREGGHPPAWARVFLKRSKLGCGVAIYLSAKGDDLCPVTALLEYMAVRGVSQGPFFLFVDGMPLTKARFVSHVRAALERAGIPCRLYSGHSFRIGTATGFHYPSVGEVVQHGILSYIRTPPAHLAQLSRTLAGAGGSR